MPGQLLANPRRASISLNITVVGGSIVGVASACALQKAGHHVTLLEKTDGQSWVSLKAPHAFFIDADLVWEESRGFTHGDLHALLCEEAAHEGVQFRYNSKVIKVDSETVSVTLEDGERITSDVLIGADGFKSLVRTSVVGQQILETRSKEVTLNFTIPTSLMEEDLKPYTEDSSVRRNGSVLEESSLTNSGRDFSMTLGYTLSEDAPELNEEWQDTYPIEHFRLDLEKFEPRVRKLLKLAENITPHILIYRPHLESFVCDRARLVLVGEAAHPLLPGQHNTALGIEDAHTLGSLFSGIQEQAQVPQLLSAYEELRQARCIATQDWEKRKRAMLTLPHGKEQEERDRKLRKAMSYGEWGHMDETIFKVIWGDEMDLFMFDATEKVEDWWTKWGPLLIRGNPHRRSLGPSLQVSISKER
ncbi:hypothetical protein H0H87_010858 [Tephrocybe sp. NHM501043]|nr:hypothetical protein H0H87_010858 [Tephrocybe sp. NHM501043]